jgi:hypothetical protein
MHITDYGKLVDYSDIPAWDREDMDFIREYAMSELRPRARHYVADKQNGAYRFAIYNNSGSGVMDLTSEQAPIDRYLGFSIKRSDGHPRSQCMIVSLLENIMSHEERWSNYRKLYKFEWGRRIAATAIVKEIAVVGKIIETKTDDNGKPVSDLVVPTRNEVVRPFSPDEQHMFFDELRKVAYSDC